VKRALFAAVLLCTLAAASTAAAGGPLITAVDSDLDAFAGAQRPLAFQLVHQAGATSVRINVVWRQVVLAGSHKPPPPFNPENPSDPAYNWTEPDNKVRLAAAAGLQPLITISGAPRWAETGLPRATRIEGYKVGSWRPDPEAAKAFAHAVALRYGGSFQGLPRVRYWEIWNEANLVGFLAPQGQPGQLESPTLYRNLLNAMADAIHAVHPDNVVGAGSTAPFSLTVGNSVIATAPLAFMREVLCMSAGAHPRPTCKAKSTFDAWSHHPFTTGGPTDHAATKDDVSLGDMPKMAALLAAAYKAHHVRSARAPSLWVTEFAWDTLPPDAFAVPIDLQARWISEALYRSWKVGVSLFTWFQLQDEPGSSQYQDGLYFLNGADLGLSQPKPSLYSFRFPFVAYRQGKKVFVWGRTPYGQRGKVLVQRMTAKGWRQMGTFRANRYGIFSGKVRYVKTPAPTPTHSETSAPSYQDLVASASPTSYWPLGEPTGPTASDLTRSNNGAYEGGVTLGVPGPIPGTTAAAFDGKTGRVRLGRVAGEHTVELWVNTRTDADAAAFSNRDTNSQFLSFGVIGTMAHSQDSFPIYAGQVADGQWHHLVYTYDSATSTGKIYVDGKLSQFGVWPRVEGGSLASIGFDATVNVHFDGQIGQVAVYPYVLSPEQIASHYVASGRSLAPEAAPGMLRAFQPSSKSGSLPFSLIRPPDLRVVPFGGGG
jgi:hypothetical protein